MDYLSKREKPLVAKGYQELEGSEFNCSPIAKHETLKILLAY